MNQQQMIEKEKKLHTKYNKLLPKEQRQPFDKKWAARKFELKQRLHKEKIWQDVIDKAAVIIYKSGKEKFRENVEKINYANVRSIHFSKRGCSRIK